MKFLLIFLFPIVFGKDVICPGGSYKCPDSATCCLLPDSTYGCCPLKNAVCCDDHIHCCPADHKCSAGMCIQNEYNTTSKQLLKSDPTHVCPGKQYSCPDESTCCESKDGGLYGCCLIPDAVCCSDGEQCCPEGTVCDDDNNRCIGKNITYEMYSSQKIKAKLNDGNDALFSQFVSIAKPIESRLPVICPSGQEYCPPNNTCCAIQPKKYGCCPYINATCCKNGIYCCPENTECHPTLKLCIPKSISFDTTGIQKLKSKYTSCRKLVQSVNITSVVCPGGSFQCPNGYTCCKLPDGNWGCCPFVKATCCRDKLHCCPEGMKCDATSQSCSQGGYTIAWQEKISAIRTTRTKYIICPDGKYQCPDESTCCQLSSGMWGCCPYDGATCCSDHLHCCPDGLKCDVIHKQCIRGLKKVPWQKKFEAEPVIKVDII